MTIAKKQKRNSFSRCSVFFNTRKEAELLLYLKLAHHPSIFMFEDMTMIHKDRSEEHTSELQSRFDLVCRLLLEKKNTHQHKTLYPLKKAAWPRRRMPS